MLLKQNIGLRYQVGENNTFSNYPVIYRGYPHIPILLIGTNNYLRRISCRNYRHSLVGSVGIKMKYKRNISLAISSQ